MEKITSKKTVDDINNDIDLLIHRQENVVDEIHAQFLVVLDGELIRKTTKHT